MATWRRWRVELRCEIKRGGNERAIELVEGIDWKTAAAIRAEALVNLDRRDLALRLLEESLERFPDNGNAAPRGKIFLLENHPERP